MKGRVLLVGADGMLGRAMHRQLDEIGADVVAPDLAELDLTKPDSIANHLSTSVDWVVNCAAYTDVDGAEENAQLADAVNGIGVGALASRSHEVGATLVTFGTDYVFDGAASSPYAVDHPQNPQNAYGRSKALGERLVQQSGVRHLSVRTSWLYAPWGNNFVSTMARLTRQRDALRVVDDQRGRPTSSRHLARTAWKLAQSGAEGTFHVTDGGECTWYELACLVNDHLGHGCTIAPCRSDEFPRPAPRPAYSVLDVSATEALVGPMPPYRLSVARALDEAHALASAT